ncbi:hypothetical protein AHAS_Ahas13G0366100 [Arachis hypogaea]
MESKGNRLKGKSWAKTGIPNRVGADPVPIMTQNERQQLGHASLLTARPRLSPAAPGMRQSWEVGHGPTTSLAGKYATLLTRQGGIQIRAVTTAESERVTDTGAVSRFDREEGRGQKLAPVETAWEEAAEMLAGRKLAMGKSRTTWEKNGYAGREGA